MQRLLSHKISQVNINKAIILKFNVFPPKSERNIMLSRTSWKHLSLAFSLLKHMH